MAKRSTPDQKAVSGAVGGRRPAPRARGYTPPAMPMNLDEALRALAQARSELATVKSERDRLQRELVTVGGMQTETVALTPDDVAQPEIAAPLPTLDDLMEGLSTYEEVGERTPAPSFSSASVAPSPVAPPEPPAPVMLAPELVFTNEDERDDPRSKPVSLRPVGGNVRARERVPAITGARTNSRLLVFVDADPPIKYPLYKPVMTIGRSEMADIRVDGDYISRVHARVSSIENGQIVAEDVASKNGIKVNGKIVKRQNLRHGDVLSLGKLHFTYIDTATAEQDAKE